MQRILFAFTLMVVCSWHGLRAEPESAAEGWPQWRGPLATGTAPKAQPPLTWSEEENIRWKMAIPGTGHSTPIVWGDRVFVTTAVDTEHQADPETIKAVEDATPRFHRDTARMPRNTVRFVVLALNRADGEILWQRTVTERVPHEGTHADGSWASGSPVTDGTSVYAYFGSFGLYALDAATGKVRWEKPFGPFSIKANFGEGTSPVLHRNRLIVCQDHEEQSFIVALDTDTGKEVWRRQRDEGTAWATPLVVEHNATVQVIASAANRIRAYDLRSGDVLWHTTGMTANVIPSPVANDDLVFCMSGFRGAALVAVRLDEARGDLAENPDAIAWTRDQGTPYVPSPLLYNNNLYFFRGNRAVLTCLDAAAGTPHYENQRLEGMRMVYPSPVGAAGRVYVTGRRGLTLVLEAGPAFRILAKNRLHDRFSASAALAGSELYLRGYESLYCIAADPHDK